MHKTASYYIQSAIVAEAMGDKTDALRLFELAFVEEKQAAFSLLSSFDIEPARSVLFRSAAALALKCKKYEEAKKMVYFGLAGNPPEGIANELVEVYELVLKAIEKMGDKRKIVLKMPHFEKANQENIPLLEVAPS
jgi:hypothetical protein